MGGSGSYWNAEDGESRAESHNESDTDADYHEPKSAPVGLGGSGNESSVSQVVSKAVRSPRIRPPSDIYSG